MNALSQRNHSVGWRALKALEFANNKNKYAIIRMVLAGLNICVVVVVFAAVVVAREKKSL